MKGVENEESRELRNERIQWRNEETLHYLNELNPLSYLPDMYEDDYLNEDSEDHPTRMSEAYETHFRSRLTYLSNREDFVSIFDYNEYKTDFYKDALSYMDQHGVATYGVLVYGTVRDFLESMDTMPYDSIHINEVLSAKPNIYY